MKESHENAMNNPGLYFHDSHYDEYTTRLWASCLLEAISRKQDSQ